MKVVLAVLLVAILALSATAECPPGEYNPGPDCSFERICPVPSAHSYREHYCDCWCGPGTIRDTVTKKCVKECPIYNPNLVG
ncbi:hypothetical protein ABMA27_015195 [Loxostege sticticalis]|uniref:TIL domain-containing protein n=1 Tax=Loxostege sticticalis TaxID=481309 RepID=A0ABR3I6R7_LOXSC